MCWLRGAAETPPTPACGAPCYLQAPWDHPLLDSPLLFPTFFGTAPTTPIQGTVGSRDPRGSLLNLFFSGLLRCCRVDGTQRQEYPAPQGRA